MSRRRRRRGESKVEYPYTFLGRQKPAGRFNHKCRIIGRGPVPEVVHVEFSNGGKFLVARRSLGRR